MRTRIPLRPGACLFALFLVTLGLGLYFLLPEQPLWTLDIAEEARGFTHDGAHFFTTVPTTATKHREVGPIRLRDSRTGREVKSFFEAGDDLQRLTISDDRRFCAAVVEPGQVRVIDFARQRSWSLAAPEVNDEYALHFAPDGNMVHVRAAHVKLPERNFLFELPSGELLAPPESIRAAQFSPDGRYTALWKKDGMHLWDSEARREVGDYLEWEENFRFSPDGRRLLTTAQPEDKAPFRPVLWDLATHRRIAELPVEMPVDRDRVRDFRYVLAAFSADGRWLATWHEHQEDGRTLEVWDSATGKRLGRHDLDPRSRRSLVFAADSASLAVIDWTEMNMQGGTGTFALTMLDMPAARVRWRRQFTREKEGLRWSGPNNPPGMSESSFRFSPGGDALSFFIPDQAQWTFLDAATGATRQSVRMLAADTTIIYLSDRAVSKDDGPLLTHARLHESAHPRVSAWLRRWLPARANFASLTLVHDASGQELMRLKLNGRAESYFSPDGQLVLTCCYPSGPVDLNRIQAWTVPPERPWLWIVGIPLSVGAGLLTLRGLSRWRKTATPSKDVARRPRP